MLTMPAPPRMLLRSEAWRIMTFLWALAVTSETNYFLKSSISSYTIFSAIVGNFSSESWSDCSSIFIYLSSLSISFFSSFFLTFLAEAIFIVIYLSSLLGVRRSLTSSLRNIYMLESLIPSALSTWTPFPSFSFWIFKFSFSTTFTFNTFLQFRRWRSYLIFSYFSCFGSCMP